MGLTTTARSLLDEKGRQIYAVAPAATVYDAIALMSEKGIGALLVMDGDRLAGILSERDYARRVVLQGKGSRDTRVEEIMTSPVITISPSATVDECMHMMTDSRVRHLPVVDGGRVAGVLSIGDIVRAVITEQRETIQHLHNYIGGSYGHSKVEA